MSMPSFAWKKKNHVHPSIDGGFQHTFSTPPSIVCCHFVIPYQHSYLFVLHYFWLCLVLFRCVSIVNQT